MVLQLGVGVRQLPGKSYNIFLHFYNVFLLRSLVVSELPFHRISLGLKCQKFTCGALALYPEGISCVLIFAHLRQKSLGSVDSLCDWHTFEPLLSSSPEPQTRTEAQRSKGELSHAFWVVARGSGSPASGSNRAAFLELLPRCQAHWTVHAHTSSSVQIAVILPFYRCLGMSQLLAQSPTQGKAHGW